MDDAESKTRVCLLHAAPGSEKGAHGAFEELPKNAARM